jgi:hypothetical protein
MFMHAVLTVDTTRGAFVLDNLDDPVICWDETSEGSAFRYQVVAMSDLRCAQPVTRYSITENST